MIKAVLVHFTLCCHMLSATDIIIPNFNFEDENVKYHFRELLKSLILLNEKRVETMQKYTQLETKNVGRNSLRIVSGEEREKPIIIVLSPTISRDPDFKNKIDRDLSKIIESLQRNGISIAIRVSDSRDITKSKTSKQNHNDKDDNNDDDSSDNSTNETDEDSDDDVSERSHESYNKTLLRYYRGCKRAKKDCKKACKQAVTDGCSRYSCRSKLKKYIKKRCKSSCNDFFD